MGNALNPSGPGFSLVLMALLIAMIYFMMIRPQKKREKAEQEMRAALRVGDEVITIGGIVGKVEKIGDKTVVVSTTAGKNKIEFLKTSIASVSKSTKTSGAAAGEASKPVEEEKAPNREKTVTPKKLGRKSEEETVE